MRLFNKPLSRQNVGNCPCAFPKTRSYCRARNNIGVIPYNFFAGCRLWIFAAAAVLFFGLLQGTLWVIGRGINRIELQGSSADVYQVVPGAGGNKYCGPRTNEFFAAQRIPARAGHNPSSALLNT